MYNPPGDPRFPPGPRPHAGQASPGASQPPQYPQPGQPAQYPQQYPPAQQQYGAPPQHQPQAQHGMPGLPMGMGGAVGKLGAGLPQLSGLPSAAAFGLGIVAVIVALVFDVIFLKVHIPGVGGYAWYLTTALSFAGAGYLGIKWTKASQTTAMTAVAVAGILYGIADLGLGVVLEALPVSNAMFLGIQGVVIACVCGAGGVRKALAERS